MVLMHSVPWMEPGSGGEDDVEWHMWKTRQWPYQDLEDGLSYFSLVKAPYANHEEAWGLLRTGLPAAERARLGLRDKNQFLRNVHPRGPAKWTPSRFRCTPCPRC